MRFSAETLKFIERASKQKNPEWLDRHRAEYERVLLDPLHALAKSLKKELATAAAGYHFPQRGLGRLKRSAIRAREYGALYKDWISYSASRPSASRFDRNPNLYFMIQPGDPDGDEVLVAGGLYMPSSRQVRALREAIANDASAFEKLFASKAFASRFRGGFSTEKISSRVPRGFDASHPRIDWIRLQAFFVWRSYTKREFASDDFAKLVAKDFIQICRMNDLLEQALQGRLPAAKKTPRPGLKTENLDSRLDSIEAPRRQMDF